MQNLRDKLLKAGLVTEKQVETALKTKSNPRPDKGPRRANAPDARWQAERPRTEAERQLDEQELQRAQAFAAREAEVSEQRRRDAARQSEARLQSERARSLRALIGSERLHETLGEVPFHFVRRSGKVGRLALTPAIARLLEEGAAAVVELPGETDPAILPSDAAKKAFRIDPRAIFFWAGPQKPIGFDDLAPLPSESGPAASEAGSVAADAPDSAAPAPPQDGANR
jgi:uncharacterized protein YaiL (DUF2058 family)